ncbi:MAG: hypothetical protein J6O50_12000 [Ruminiclostridium sp.]|nr:hypothetical protein [Ruminiclostridium sp.]
MSEPNSKGRLLFLEHYLLENTDDENPITAEQTIKAYEDHGYKAHRNTIRDDIDVLQASGMDIISGSSGKYKNGNRDRLKVCMQWYSSMLSITTSAAKVRSLRRQCT